MTKRLCAICDRDFETPTLDRKCSACNHDANGNTAFPSVKKLEIVDVDGQLIYMQQMLAHIEIRSLNDGKTMQIVIQDNQKYDCMTNSGHCKTPEDCKCEEVSKDVEVQ